MLMNYHEMTMNESRHSPARKKQFLVICAVMLAAFVYSTMTAGILYPVDAKEGIFPGGHYIYKNTTRDFAVAQGAVRKVAKDLNLRESNYSDLLYTMYLDDPQIIQAHRTRFTYGALIDNSQRKTIEKPLLQRNEKLNKPVEHPNFEEEFKQTPYSKGELPSVDALVVNFPYTNGFISALLHTYRVIPALRKLAKEQKVSNPVVLTTCSIPQAMCSHYAPLVDTEKFFMGMLLPSAYEKSLPEQESMVDWAGVYEDFKAIFFFLPLP